MFGTYLVLVVVTMQFLGGQYDHLDANSVSARAEGLVGRRRLTTCARADRRSGLGLECGQIPDDTSYYPQQQFSTFLVSFDVFWQVRPACEARVARPGAHARAAPSVPVGRPGQIVTADDWEFLMFDTMQAQWSIPTGYPAYNVLAVAISGFYIFVLHLISCCACGVRAAPCAGRAR